MFIQSPRFSINLSHHMLQQPILLEEAAPGDFEDHMVQSAVSTYYHADCSLTDLSPALSSSAFHFAAEPNIRRQLPPYARPHGRLGQVLADQTV